jgi:GAF domain-containing protein
MSPPLTTATTATTDTAAAAEPTDLDELIERLRTMYRDVRRGSSARSSELEGRLAGMQQDLHDTEQLLIAAEQQAARLASLYAASYQLHSLDPAEVCAAIGEIAVDLLGVRRCVLLMASDDQEGVHDLFDLVAGQSAAPPLAPPRYGGGDTLVDVCLGSGGLRLGPAPGSQALAVVPLAMQGHTVGALVVLELLPHLTTLRWEDRGLLDLLGAHAASALAGARAFQGAQRKLKTLEGLMALVRRGPGASR